MIKLRLINRLFQLGLVFVLLLSSIQLPSRLVLAKEQPEPCPCQQGQCTSECKECSWYNSLCPSPTPRSPTPPEAAEDITGKITNPALSETLNRISGVSFLGRFLRTGINLGFLVGAVVFFFLLLTGAIKWIASGSDKTQLEGSQKQITHALVGLVILLSIFAIISVIESIFGISITNINLPIL